MPEKNTLPARTSVIDINKAIVVRSSDGSKIRRIKTQRRLSVEDTTLVKVIKAKKAWKGKEATSAVIVPSANGFMQLAGDCGIALNHPDAVIVDGVEQPNGFRDKTGTYYFRARAGGYTALGQPFIVDRTVDYNVDRYNVQDLLAKAKWDDNEQYFKVLPFRGKDGDGVLKGEPKEGDWAGYQVDGSTVLWADCAAPEFVKWLGEMNNRSKNAIRTCQTFADRNAIAAHPALPAKKKFETAEVVVDCVSWFAEKGTITFEQLLAHGNVELDTTDSISIDQDEYAKKIIDVDSEAVPLEKGDVREELEDDDNIPLDDRKPEPEEKTPAKTTSKKKDDSDKERNKLIKKVSELASVKNTSYRKARKSMGIDDAEAIEMLSFKQLEELYNLLKIV